MFPLGYIKSSYHAFKHAAVGIRDVISGQSWRRSLLDEAADAYVDSVWCEGDESLGERDKHFFQVGATFAGRRITDQQHDELCNSVVRGLQITNTDVVVDVCCGNGIVTDVLAQHASTVIGVDFSSRLLEIAKAHYMQQNVSYIQMDLSKPELARFAKFPPVTKVCFHSALQYFTVEDLREILLFLKTLSRGEPLKIFIGAIPERSRKFVFYKTFGNRVSFFRRWFQRKADVIGSWWDRSVLHALATDMSGSCECFDQEVIQHTSHYRFDAILSFP
eukprot:CAMPEP_0197583634 /NCGR_PEP_ID=MMETSP1326-20131121/6488_1 /TAXON_ID=1155430 /ORGANISM="Genus nov. species nov., Strain RCC2288" /LENGTH=275 /DNA_ID=CAMNT_0043147885 /DNA_START=296 /DNA_END=1123 /DNA_ORIENTATION=+